MLKMYYEDKELDIHGMIEPEAIVFLNNALDGLEDQVTEISIVHGYRSGSVLLNLVRNKYWHPRIKRKYHTLNPGETIFELYTKEEAKKNKHKRKNMLK